MRKLVEKLRSISNCNLFATDYIHPGLFDESLPKPIT